MTASIAGTTEGQGQEPMLIDIKALKQMLGRDVRSLERDELARRIPRPIRLGRSKRWRVAEIRDWVEAGCPKVRLWEAMRKPMRTARAG